eukprot:GHVL01010330.1.p1 GENE.GHVL01010330.1~~GHVL01010330.1.p1  ORF type:complete len:388 (+),score=70.31 GHVL01010330.1:192-1355(+)
MIGSSSSFLEHSALPARPSNPGQCTVPSTMKNALNPLEGQANQNRTPVAPFQISNNEYMNIKSLNNETEYHYRGRKTPPKPSPDRSSTPPDRQLVYYPQKALENTPNYLENSRVSGTPSPCHSSQSWGHPMVVDPVSFPTWPSNEEFGQPYYYYHYGKESQPVKTDYSNIHGVLTPTAANTPTFSPFSQDSNTSKPIPMRIFNDSINFSNAYPPSPNERSIQITPISPDRTPSRTTQYTPLANDRTQIYTPLANDRTQYTPNINDRTQNMNDRTPSRSTQYNINDRTPSREKSVYRDNIDRGWSNKHVVEVDSGPRDSVYSPNVTSNFSTGPRDSVYSPKVTSNFSKEILTSKSTIDDICHVVDEELRLFKYMVKAKLGELNKQMVK